MFLTQEELKTVAYEYIVDQITEDDDTIVLEAIETAIEEVKGHLALPKKKEILDGRPIYDVNRIFAFTGNDRNKLLLSITKDCALYWLVGLANPDMSYEKVQERYDRSKSILNKIQKGEMVIASLPVLDPELDNAANQEPFAVGSRPKFRHY